MFGWNTKSFDSIGIVFFPGTMPPRPENFAQFTEPGVRIETKPAGGDSHWVLAVEHPKFGSATISCRRDPSPIPDVILNFDPRLSDEDRTAIRSSGTAIKVETTGLRKNVLRDRKILLRILNWMLAGDGLMAWDVLAYKFWTRDMLADELAHDADLDVDSIFIFHAVTNDDENADGTKCVEWMHSHGLAELGAMDFDIIRPAPMLLGNGYDSIRALVYKLLEFGDSAAGELFPIIKPGDRVQLVPVEEYDRKASAYDAAPRKDATDPAHRTKRVVLCEPQQRRFFGLLAPGRLRPSHMLSTVNSDRFMACFTNTATHLMEQRASETFHIFRTMAKEFEEFKVGSLVKLGYRVDGGDENNREHLWFEVHDTGDDWVDATLQNQPFNIAGMKLGQRGRFPADKLTDWMIFTPAGQITPRSMIAARRMRSHLPELRKMIAEQAAAGLEKK